MRARIDLLAGARVLDVGCGAGWLWSEGRGPLSPGVALTLCDLSSGMVEEAVQRASAGDRLASVDGRTADAQSLPFDAGSFDRVIANHMLYHLPDPELGVAELARVAAAGGILIVATNGRRHMQELHEVEAAVFGADSLDRTVDVFGAENGVAILREHFAEVRWEQFPDELRCTDPADVLAYSCSSPPGEDATPEQRAELQAALARRFKAGGGVMTITKDVGCFICHNRG